GRALLQALRLDIVQRATTFDRREQRAADQVSSGVEGGRLKQSKRNAIRIAAIEDRFANRLSEERTGTRIRDDLQRLLRPRERPFVEVVLGIDGRAILGI